MEVSLNPPPEPKHTESLFLPHHPTFSSLSNSAQGCEFCSAIVTELSQVPGRSARLEQSEKDGVDTRVRIAIGQTERYGTWKMFDHIAVVIGFPVQTIAMSEQEYYKWFMEHEVDSFWIKFSMWRCSDSPDSLNSTINGDGGIDLGSPGSSAQPKLLLTRGQLGQYVALSHCWGGDIPCKTMTALVDDYLQGLPPLPHSFRDAIRITKELGFRYLWIDSLCIIQDSVEDWQQESALMRDVYRNAAITISASASKDSHGGMLNLYGYDQPDIRKWCRLKLHSKSPDLESVQLSSFYVKESFEDCVDKLPLPQRGWTLQERLLSQRILHYGKDQIYFQCRSQHLNADKTHIIHGVIGRWRSTRALLNLSNPPVEDIMPNKRLATSGDWVSEAWRDVVVSYSGHRELTKPADKLPALSGVVSLFQEKTNDQYLAGLWKADLAHGLLWRLGSYSGPSSVQWTVHPDRNPIQWHKYPERAPSWSWARWDGSITFPFNARIPLKNDNSATLLDYKIHCTGRNPLGEVSGGTLRISCWTRAMTFAEIYKEIGWPALDRPRGTWTFKDDDENQSAFLEEDHIYTVVYVETFTLKSVAPKGSVGYLLLDPVPEVGDDVYERVGIAPRDAFKYLDTFDPIGWKETELTVI
ncbi:uncharacterized protein PAC_10143 [Phialocephala subalpina]|uniref:Heterokaryon incompatibility domain-containing protein n=1 Tax=Phialocephala subalpina TaxID=576137 RepID=A0A1L7X5G0_9HELO|nr:uncharacterized protein PAC_10143 [Phialocephala subalpina]